MARVLPPGLNANGSTTAVWPVRVVAVRPVAASPDATHSTLTDGFNKSIPPGDQLITSLCHGRHDRGRAHRPASAAQSGDHMLLLKANEASQGLRSGMIVTWCLTSSAVRAARRAIMLLVPHQATFAPF